MSCAAVACGRGFGSSSDTLSRASSRSVASPDTPSDSFSAARPSSMPRGLVNRVRHGASAVAASISCPPAIPFAARSRGSVEKIRVEIEPDFFSSITSHCAACARLQLRPTFGAEDPFIAQLLLALRDEARAGNPGGSLYGESLGTALVAHLVRRHSVCHQTLREHRGGLPMNRLRCVTEYIEDNLEADLALVDLANILRMNVFHFARSFKQSTEVPPHQYVLGNASSVQSPSWSSR